MSESVELEPVLSAEAPEPRHSLDSTHAVADVPPDALDELANSAPETPDERSLKPDLDRFMVACQQGDLAAVQSLLGSAVGPNDAFADGITGLHWAAINNRLSIVKFLVEHGADPNVFGGELHATPLHWACRNGLVYIVHYLLHHGADPTLKDSQSYNSLHLAVHSSNIMLVIYILYQCCSGLQGSPVKQIYIDEPDGAARTSLHWACYQGDVLTVQCLLKLGADVNLADNTLFIPLHWAFMRCYKNILKLLIEHGSDLFVQNDKGKDSFGVARDMKCYSTWVAALNESGRFESAGWQKRDPKFDPKYGKLVTFFVPYVVLPALFKINDYSTGMFIPKVFLSVLIVLATYFLLTKLVIPTYLIDKAPLPKSPLLAGIFSGTFFWVVAVSAFNIVPSLLFSGFFTFLQNIILIALIAAISYTFFKSMFINPGFIPVPADNSVVYEQIIGLIDAGKFDTDHFCANAFVKKPLRSKYSNYNKKLVARFDHYCPWVYNEIGVRNHKLFMYFVYSLTAGILVFSSLSFKYFDKLEDAYGSDAEDNCFLKDELCLAFSYSSFHFNLLMWVWLQFIWIAVLCFSQTFQILKGLTTYEFTMLNNNSSIYNHSTLPRDFGGSEPQEPPKQQRGSSNPCFKLLGLDQFSMTVKIAIYSLLGKGGDLDLETSGRFFEIPSDYGFKQNWLDFFFLGEIKPRNLFYLPIEGENNLNGQIVDYYKLYEYPAKSSASLA